MRRIEESVLIKAPAEAVFNYADDINKVGMHMSESSGMMMGSKLTLEILSMNKTGEGAIYRWYGKVMGMRIDFSEMVTKWVKDKERVWKTIGEPKLIIMDGYKMWFKVEPVKNQTKLTMGVEYELPKDGLGRILGIIAGDWYSRWCLKNMTRGAIETLENNG